MFKRSILALLPCALLLALLLVPVSASAETLEPWWHLGSGSPARIQPGLAKDEVQELKLSAVGGRVLIASGSNFALFAYNAEAPEVQSALEGLYGAANVAVTGGPTGKTPGQIVTELEPYIVTFKGELASQPVPLMETGYEPVLKGNVRAVRVSAGQADGQVIVTAANLGDAPANTGGVPLQIEDELPSGLRAVSVTYRMGSPRIGFAPVCSVERVTCVVAEAVPPYAKVEVVIGVIVEHAPAAGAVNRVSVSGGEALSVSLERPLRVGVEPSSGVEGYELTPEEPGGALDTQAGSHPFQLTTTLALNQASEGEPVALAKDLDFKLPPGLVGNPTVLQQCTLKHFLAETFELTGEKTNECPAQTAIGVASVTVHGRPPATYTFVVPLFNLEPAVGEPARFGFWVPVPGGFTPVILDTSLRTGEDYGVTVHVNNISQTAGFTASQVTFWGVPGDPRHNAQRGWGCLEGITAACRPSEAIHPPPFLSMPTSCTGALQSSVEADSWVQEGVFGSVPAVAMPALDGCNRVPFSPSDQGDAGWSGGEHPDGVDGR